MSKVLIVGGGAAGMFAAITAARKGHEVFVYEKNEKLSAKNSAESNKGNYDRFSI